MKFEEILSELKSGKKIRRKSWEINEYIDKTKLKKEVDEDSYLQFLAADDWEILEEFSEEKIQNTKEIIKKVVKLDESIKNHVNQCIAHVLSNILPEEIANKIFDYIENNIESLSIKIINEYIDKNMKSYVYKKIDSEIEKNIINELSKHLLKNIEFNISKKSKNIDSPKNKKDKIDEV